ncbi:hypothetical protein [Roseibium sp.]|uniref:hypothetical protein n=1 Tax=Roseibium sp. TaxID=1936156 RepID=UPI003A96C5AA
MTTTDDTGPSPEHLHPFSVFMAGRGDGPDPRLAAALAKPGSASGPTATLEALPDNVITVDFQSSASRGVPSEQAQPSDQVR